MKKMLFLFLGMFFLYGAYAQKPYPSLSSGTDEKWYYIRFVDADLVVEQHGVLCPDDSYGPNTLTAEDVVKNKDSQLWKVVFETTEGPDDDPSAQKDRVFIYSKEPSDRGRVIRMAYRSGGIGCGYGGSSLCAYEEGMLASYANPIIETTESGYNAIQVGYGLIPDRGSEPYARLLNATPEAPGVAGDFIGRNGPALDFNYPPNWIEFILAEEMFPESGANYENKVLKQLTDITEIQSGSSWKIFDIGENEFDEKIAKLQITAAQAGLTAEVYRSNTLYESSTDLASTDPAKWTYLTKAEFSEAGTLTVYSSVISTSTGRYLKVQLTEGDISAISAVDVWKEYIYLGTPYKSHKVASSYAVAPTVIEAEDFDNGGLDEAYYAATGSNTYRPEPIAIAEGGSNGYYLETADGEWFKYSVEIQEKGDYDIKFFGKAENGSSFDLYFNDIVFRENIAIPASSDFGQIALDKVGMEPGIYVFDIRSKGAGFDKFEIVRSPYLGAPYNGTPFMVPCRVPAAEFDFGGPNVAFFETDFVWLNGALNGRIIPNGMVEPLYEGEPEDCGQNPDYGGYRWCKDAFGVDFWEFPEATGDGAPEGIYIADVRGVEWYVYTLDIPETTEYDFKVYYSGKSDFPLIVRVDGDLVYSGRIEGTSASTETEYDDYYFEYALLSGVKLPAGVHQITMQVPTAFNYFDIVKSSRVPFNDAPLEIPGIVNFAQFDRGGEGTAYHDKDPENGGNTNSIRQDEGVKIASSPYGDYITSLQTGEWLLYSVDVKYTGTYILKFVVAGEGSGAYSLQAAGKTIVDKQAAPNTSSLTNFEEEWFYDIPLIAGPQVVRLYINEGGFSIVNVEFEADDVAIKSPVELIGKVYIENHNLHLEGYSSKASVVVYNLVGQKIANAEAFAKSQTITLQTKGIYVVKVSDNGATHSYKVIVK